MNLTHITAKEYDEIINEDKETCVVVFSKPTCSVCKELGSNDGGSRQAI